MRKLGPRRLTKLGRICSICRIDKPLSEFHSSKRSSIGVDSECKLCKSNRVKRSMAKHGDKYKAQYLENRSNYSSRRKLQKNAFKTELINMLGGKCYSCGLVPSEEWPNCCFDFHHLVMSKSSVQIGRLLDHHSVDGFERMKKEASGCVVLCSNCHRKEHNKIGFKKSDS